MATQAATFSDVVRHQGAKQVAWSTLANGDSGAWVSFPDFSGKTFQVYGTFGAAGNVILEGTNDLVPTTAAPLSDWQGNNLSTITAARLATSRDMPLWVRPRVSAGDGTTALTVQLVMHRQDIAMAG